MNLNFCQNLFIPILRKQNHLKTITKFIRTYDRKYSNQVTNQNSITPRSSEIFNGIIFHNDWPNDVKRNFLHDMTVTENFIAPEEEVNLVAEAEKCMKRMRYQYDHWDDAIHGYREMEKENWSQENNQVLVRVRQTAFKENILPHVHILDLAENGVIKPHVDSSRYCGSTIAGLSLLTDCIMRLRRVDEMKYKQGREGEQAPADSDDKPAREFNYFADILLTRRSLYIMKDSARYNFSHEVLANQSLFGNKEIKKHRRISIICRNQA